AAWPSVEAWDGLARAVGGRLGKGASPLDACRDDPKGAACAEGVREHKNPYYLGDNVALTGTTGWIDAWTAQPSAYARAAAGARAAGDGGDGAAAVNFAGERNLRLVVKGGGHSYLGTSNAPDSLMVWTRAMKDIALLDAFVPEGCGGPGVPAVSVGAGAIW